MYEAKTHDIIISLEKKTVHHFTIWKVFSAAPKLYNGMNTEIQIITRQPTMKTVRNAMALKDCERCQHSENWSSFGFQLCAQFRLGKFLCMKSTANLPHSSCPGFPPPPALHHRNNQLWTFPSSLTFVLAIQQFLPGFSSSFTPCELILLAAALTQAAVGLFFSPPQCE